VTKAAVIVSYCKAFATKADARVSAIRRDEAKPNNIHFWGIEIPRKCQSIIC